MIGGVNGAAFGALGAANTVFTRAVTIEFSSYYVACGALSTKELYDEGHTGAAVVAGGLTTAGAASIGFQVKGLVKFNRANTAKVVPKGSENSYNPANPGPLNQKTAETFTGGSYKEIVLTENTTFYRVHGGRAEKIGSYMSRTPQKGGLQSKMDLALKPEWGNTAAEVTTVMVPKGTVIYEGTAAPQGNFLGGGNQVYIPRTELDPIWFMD